MRRWWSGRRLRATLTLWYVAAMVAVLAVYVVVVFGFVTRSASRALDDRLQGDFTWAAEMWDQNPDGTLTWFDSSTGQDEDLPWLQVWDPDGRLLFRTAVAQRNPLRTTSDLAAAATGRIVSVTSAASLAYRVLSRRVTIGGRDVVIQVAKSEAAMRADLGELLLYLVFGLPLGVGVAGVGGYAMARRALRPVDRMADHARSITAARLSERLPVHDPHDELGRLAAVFNETLERLDRAFTQMQRFTADVSHELRTPLAAMRTVGEVGLRERRGPAAYQRVIESMLEEVDRLSSLIDRLLLLSRAESGQTRLARAPVDLGALARHVAEQLSVLAEEKGQCLRVTDEAGIVEADRIMLQLAITNLIDNAIKYSPEGTDIGVALVRQNGRVVLDVQDAGPGIDPERRGRIFDRFVRASAEDSRGTGLGLSIAKWAVEANGGELTCHPREGGGSTFRIAMLPTDADRSFSHGSVAAASGFGRAAPRLHHSDR